MIEYFSQWISGIICVGILLGLLRLVTPHTNMTKYIYSLIGLIALIVILKPVISVLKIDGIDNIILNATQAIEDKTNSVNITDYSNYEEINKNNLKEEFAKNLGEDIEKKAEEIKIKQDNASLNVKVKISNTYNIEKINVAYTGSNMQEMIHFISSNYDTTKDKIIMSRGG